MEVRKEIKTYKTYMVCPRCKEGYMTLIDPYILFKNYLLSSGDDVKYKHGCSNCKYEEEYEKMYPIEETVEIEVE